MRHGVFGKQLSRSKNERRRLRQNLLRDLFKRGAIVTTKAKAQSVRGLAEKLITKAKGRVRAEKREVFSVLTDNKVVEILWERARVQFKNRTSGFTRVSIMGQRRGRCGDFCDTIFCRRRGQKSEGKASEPVKKLKQKSC